MSRPHVILFVADQLRFDLLGAYGDQQCPTPGLDRLAERSVIFERHFTPCPLDLPARGSLMTGLYPRQHGAIINGWLPSERSFGTLRPGLDLLPQKLTEGGYRFVHVGVQHVRTAPELPALVPGGEFVGPAGAAEYLQELQARGLHLGDLAAFRDPVLDYEHGKPVVFSSTSPRPGIFPLRDDLFYDDTLARTMVEIIESHGRSPQSAAKPLALMGMFWLPHPPLWAPRLWAEKIRPEQVTLPATVGRWFPGMAPMQLANIAGQLGAHISAEQWRPIWAMYMGMVALLDHCVRRVLAALDHAGMFDEALVIFTSDHGEMLGSHRLYGKMCLYEEAIRVPLLLKLPGQLRGRRVLELTDHLDLASTIADLAGLEPLRGSPGRSLRSLAEGHPNHEPQPQVFAAYDGNAGRGFAQRMIRTGTHKLIHNIGDHAELYDLIQDPRETRNLVGTEPLRAVELDLRTRLNIWMDQLGDDQPRA